MNCDIENIASHIPLGEATLKILTQNVRSIECDLANFFTILESSLVIC